MITIKEIKVTQIYNGINSFPLPNELQKWFTENTMFRSQLNSTVIHSFSLILAPGMVMLPTPIDGIKPGVPSEIKYNILAKNIAFKNGAGNWDFYEKIIFDVYNRKTVDESSVKENNMFSGFRSNNSIIDDWVVTIKTIDAPNTCDLDLSLEELFNKL